MYRCTAPAPRASFRLLLVLLPLLALAALAPRSAAAQDPADTARVADPLLEIRLADGSVLFGRIVEDRGDVVVIETGAGARIEVARARIVSMRPARGQVRNGEVWPEDPHGTRLFFAPTGRNLVAGEGYFGVYELFFPFVTYGVTDRLTISGGTPIIPEAIGQVGYIAPKLQLISSPRFNAGVGVLAAFVTVDGGGSAGIAYGVATWGDRDNALTVGAGLPFVTDGGDDHWGDQPLMMIGGERRVSRRTKLLTENYLMVGEEGAVVSGGVRFFSERLSADFGLGGFLGGGDSFCCFPLVNFVYSFGKK